MLGVVEHQPRPAIAKGACPPTEYSSGLKDGDGAPFFGEFVCAGDAGYPAPYDCDVGRYGLPPGNFDLSRARAAMPTFFAREIAIGC